MTEYKHAHKNVASSCATLGLMGEEEETLWPWVAEQEQERMWQEVTPVQGTAGHRE